MDIYCVKCRKHTETTNLEERRSKNNKRMLTGECVVCGKRKNKFIANDAPIIGGCMSCMDSDD